MEPSTNFSRIREWLAEDGVFGETWLFYSWRGGMMALSEQNTTLSAMAERVVLILTAKMNLALHHHWQEYLVGRTKQPKLRQVTDGQR